MELYGYGGLLLDIPKLVRMSLAVQPLCDALHCVTINWLLRGVGANGQALGQWGRLKKWAGDEWDLGGPKLQSRSKGLIILGCFATSLSPASIKFCLSQTPLVAHFFDRLH